MSVPHSLWEFEGHEFREVLSGVGQSVGVGAGEPFCIAGLEVAGHGALSFQVAAEIEIGDGNEQTRAGVKVFRDRGAGLEFELGDADAVFDEEDFFSAALQDVETSVFVPVGGRVAEFVVLQKFDDDIAEGLSREIAGHVGEPGGEQVGVAVLELDGDGILALDRIDDFGRAEVDVDVVVAVNVHQSLGVRSDFNGEDTDLIVGEGLVVVRFGADFDFGGRLGRQDGG